MNIFNKYGVVLCMATIMLMCACNRPKKIPEDVMQKIITESLITDATLREGRAKSTGRGTAIFPDTADYYKPIVEKYGYTMRDVRHTIAYMATRKSNPMNNILDNVNRNIELQQQKANALFRAKMKFDTLALAFFADTVYRNDTTVKGDFSKYRIFIPNPRSGDYTLSLRYRSIEDYRARTKSIKYRISSPPRDSVQPLSGTFYLSRNRQEGTFSDVITVPTNVFDSLNIMFTEPQKPKDLKLIDTSYIRDIRIIYHPLIEDARTEFFYLLTGFGKPLRDVYEEPFDGQKDSLPVPLFR